MEGTSSLAKLMQLGVRAEAAGISLPASVAVWGEVAVPVLCCARELGERRPEQPELSIDNEDSWELRESSKLLRRGTSSAVRLFRRVVTVIVVLVTVLTVPWGVFSFLTLVVTVLVFVPSSAVKNQSAFR